MSVPVAEAILSTHATHAKKLTRDELALVPTPQGTDMDERFKTSF